MHRLFIALLLLPGAVLSAQTPAISNNRTDPSSVVLRSIPEGTDCPIGFHAERQSAAQIFSASDAPKNDAALGLHLTLDHRAAPAIESIKVTVYGVSPRGRVVPTELRAADEHGSGTISKSFQLQRSADDETLNHVEVWMHQVGALLSVDLNEIRYADGTSWHPSADATCRAVPSNFVLIGQR